MTTDEIKTDCGNETRGSVFDDINAYLTENSVDMFESSIETQHSASIRDSAAVADLKSGPDANAAEDDCQSVCDAAEKNGSETPGAEVDDSEKSLADKENLQEHKFGKFKNPQDLLKAYQELEREFTRRSQRLAELENGADAKECSSEGDWKVAVDKFFDETPSARPFAKEIANELIAVPELKDSKDCLSRALTRVLVKKFRTPQQLMSDGEFLKSYVLSSDEVKNAVIGEYLDGVRQGAPPRTLSGAGRACVAPKRTAESIEDAGRMFLRSNE